MSESIDDSLLIANDIINKEVERPNKSPPSLPTSIGSRLEVAFVNIINIATRPANAAPPISNFCQGTIDNAINEPANMAIEIAMVLIDSARSLNTPAFVNALTLSARLPNKLPNFPTGLTAASRIPVNFLISNKAAIIVPPTNIAPKSTSLDLSVSNKFLNIPAIESTK